ncbi:FprA family A-type flavoprotein [Bacillus toyonensis]|uniref:FprA family A-type flavoprotein n=1 Tax=Bacillus thuringiensis serovar mexicanensis TaxID=180868 RepID=A0A242W0Z0_BACTU|nr:MULTISPECIES: FprA family A-type flavoprotein [Bacillus cereus group]EEM56214.1 Flavodoxin [Bacillus thuringiensis serovar monterrey BGSC 4AJ1]MEB9673064.1 FprA family A-type flavoprotein [Bacillus anthracis]MED3541548.1 FprA family A-type flavoprotein [Bacillus toyonensis]MEE2021485.1 FprA family A-type flavoprotein [Bacillus toyonensis]OTW45093.1 FprA family A-type flavoprotein [Bacillus thuringiensis serovar mexicanensis]
MSKEIKLTKDIYWVGKVDNREVPFHRLILAKGTTYNAYLLKTEKPTVIDTVDIEFGREFVESLSKLIDPQEIQYIVVNHTEPDHSGGLAALASRATNATIVCTEIAVPEIQEMYKLHNRKFLVVKDGDTLDIGGKTLKFKETPYLHTEETMITYCVEDKILFPCDIFSTHIANDEIFSDKANVDITEDFIGYYNAIIHPHRRYVRTLIEALKGLDVQMIAPSHGYILRQDIQKYINLYANMSRDTNQDKKVTIVYTTIKNNTKKVANIIKETLEADNIHVTVFNADKAKKLEVLKSIQEADAVFIGSSTRYADMIGNLEDILKEMTEMNLEGKIGASFGSYGWSGEAIEVIQDYLNETNMNVQSTSKVIKSTGMTHVEFPIRIRFSPKDEKKVKKIQHATTFVTDLLLSSI